MPLRSLFDPFQLHLALLQSILDSNLSSQQYAIFHRRLQHFPNQPLRPHSSSQRHRSRLHQPQHLPRRLHHSNHIERRSLQSPGVLPHLSLESNRPDKLHRNVFWNWCRRRKHTNHRQHGLRSKRKFHDHSRDAPVRTKSGSHDRNDSVYFGFAMRGCLWN